MWVFAQEGQNGTVYVGLESNDGTPGTGLAAADLTGEYIRPLDASWTAFALSDLAAADDPHADGGIVELDNDATYRLDIPDAVLASGENFALVKLTGSSIKPCRVMINLDPEGEIERYAVEAAGTNSATQFQSDCPETDEDAYARSFVKFLTGALKGEQSQITAYDASTGTFTVEDALTAAPQAGDEFKIVSG